MKLWYCENIPFVIERLEEFADPTFIVRPERFRHNKDMSVRITLNNPATTDDLDKWLKKPFSVQAAGEESWRCTDMADAVKRSCETLFVMMGSEECLWQQARSLHEEAKLDTDTFYRFLKEG